MCPVPPFTITLEEHATLPSLGDESPFYNEIWKTFPSVRNKLKDLSSYRTADLDTGNVRIQVISALPGMASLASPSSCSAANDELAAHIATYPSRFAGFAALPMSDPEEAAAELDRAVTSLGLVGAMIDNHLPSGEHYDDRRFWPIFAKAQRLDVPIYIHPAPATETDMHGRFSGPSDHVISMGLSTGAWGWHENIGLHVIKLFAAGLFTTYPRLKLIIGHMGEMLPMMIDRIDRLEFFKHNRSVQNISFSDVWARNIWITTSGIFSVRTLEMLLKVTKVERVMYSVDSPFEKSETGWRFIEEVAKKGVLDEEEMRAFAYGNAVGLLKLEGRLEE